MNRITEVGKAVSNYYSTWVPKVSTLVDKHKVVKHMYMLGIAANIYIAYRLAIRVTALKEVEQHLEAQVRSILQPKEESKEKSVERFLKERQLKIE